MQFPGPRLAQTAHDRTTVEPPAVAYFAPSLNLPGLCRGSAGLGNSRRLCQVLDCRCQASHVCSPLAALHVPCEIEMLVLAVVFEVFHRDILRTTTLPH